MEKSRLGITVNLFAALLYFMGATGNLFVVVVVAGYILLVEENAKLKRTTVKVLIFAVFWAVVVSGANWLTTFSSSFFTTLNNYHNFKESEMLFTGASDRFRVSFLYQFLQFIPVIINSVPHFVAISVMIILGFRAYRQVDVKIKWIDKILDKHFSDLGTE